MTIIYLMIGCSISIALVFLIGFLWSIRSGQYDDTYTPSVRMLFDGSELSENISDGKPAAEIQASNIDPSQAKA
jgi:cbb3-type cytochrome oxidase maturation protein